MSNIADHIDASLSVNEILLRYPAALPALKAAGIDTCCGGAKPLSVAAQTAGVELDELLVRIAEAH